MHVRIIDGIVEKIRRKGAGAVVRRALEIAVSPIYLRQRLYVIVHDLDGDLPAVVPPAGYTFGNLGPDDLDQLVPLVGRKRVEKYRRRLAEGMICYAFRKDRQVTNFFWSSPNDVVDDILGIRIPVGKDEAYSFDTFTHLEHRHRGLFFSLLKLHLHDLKNRGFRRILGTHNPQDMRYVYPRYQKAGIPADIIRVVDLRKIFFVHLTRWSDYDGHISRTDDSRKGAEGE